MSGRWGGFPLHERVRRVNPDGQPDEAEDDEEPKKGARTNGKTKKGKTEEGVA